MQRKSHDLFFIFALWLPVLTTCYYAGMRYGFADAPLLQNCANCACKDVTAWQVTGDSANQAHGYRVAPIRPPQSWRAVSSAQLKISTIPNSCDNGTGDVDTINPPAGSMYGNFQYSGVPHEW